MSDEMDFDQKNQVILNFQNSTGLSFDQTKEIFDLFFDSLSDSKLNLVNELKTLDYGNISQLAHKLRGTAGSLMIDDIFKLSSDLEKAAKAQEAELTKRLGQELLFAIEKYSV